MPDWFSLVQFTFQRVVITTSARYFRNLNPSYCGRGLSEVNADCPWQNSIVRTFIAYNVPLSFPTIFRTRKTLPKEPWPRTLRSSNCDGSALSWPSLVTSTSSNSCESLFWRSFPSSSMRCCKSDSLLWKENRIRNYYNSLWPFRTNSNRAFELWLTWTSLFYPACLTIRMLAFSKRIKHLLKSERSSSNSHVHSCHCYVFRQKRHCSTTIPTRNYDLRSGIETWTVEWN